MLVALLLFVAPGVPVQAARLPDPASSAVLGTTFHLAVTPNLFAGDVSVLDTDTHTEIARIPVGVRPNRVAMSADGARAYVACEGGPTIQVHAVDLDALAVVDVLDVPTPSGAIPIDFEVSPDGKWLALARQDRSVVYLIDTATLGIVASRELCPPCDGFAGPLSAGVKLSFTSDSTRLWAATSWVETLSLLDVPSADLVDEVPGPSSFGSSPYGDLSTWRDLDRLALVNPTDRTLRIYEGISGSFGDVALPEVARTNQDVAFADDLVRLGFSEIAFDPGPDAMTVLDFPHETIHEIPAPETWRNLEYLAARQEMWVKNGNGVSIFDMKGLTRGPDVPAGSSFAFLEIAFTPDGRFLYYPGTNDEVVVVDVATRTIVTTIPTGDNPRGVFMQGDASTSSY